TISASPFLDFGDVITGTLPGRYTQYGASLDSTYFLSRHISFGINYRYVKRDGSGPGTSYKQNLVGISVKYQF
ncbi:MAG: outer membrane beta-barrel protein, partial [Verrucomicrobia bacterium]|nr:outer membrane beta-barrel protein [Verrucomicrobiota bacterium]